MRQIYLMTALVLAVAIPVLFTSGCADPVGQPGVASQGSGDVNLYRDIQFDDIPGPVEYYLVESESHSFQGSLFRTGMLVYEGAIEWTRAIDFYRTQVPPSGWTPLPNETEVGFDFRVLRFRKGPESLIITVRQLRNGSRAEIQLDNIERNDLLLRGRLKPE